MSIAKENSKVILQQAVPDQEPVMYKYEHLYGYLSDQYSEIQWIENWSENWIETKLYAAPVDIEALTQERDEYRAKYNECYEVLNDLIKERDEMLQAAKLALDALVAESRTTESNVTLARILTAIAALKKAGVQ